MPPELVIRRAGVLGNQAILRSLAVSACLSCVLLRACNVSEPWASKSNLLGCFPSRRVANEGVRVLKHRAGQHYTIVIASFSGKTAHSW